MAVETESDRPVGWYVSRVVNLPSERAQLLGLLGGVVTPSGASLRIGKVVEHGAEQELEDHRSYSGTLSFPGLRAPKVKVELIVSRYSGKLAEVGLRPVSRISQRRIGAERYFDAAWAVLDGVVSAAQAAQAEPMGERAPSWAARRFARAS